MARKKSDRGKRQRDEDLQGAPMPEATVVPPEQAPEDAVLSTETGPTPDGNEVDAVGEALGVPRAPDDEVTSSTDILEGRDKHRWEQDE